jgi:hypothetical protein
VYAWVVGSVVGDGDVARLLLLAAGLDEVGAHEGWPGCILLAWKMVWRGCMKRAQASCQGCCCAAVQHSLVEWPVKVASLVGDLAAGQLWARGCVGCRRERPGQALSTSRGIGGGSVALLPHSCSRWPTLSLYTIRCGS